MAATRNDYQIWRTGDPKVFLHGGEKVTPPENWTFVPSGDAGLTRRLKTAAADDCWIVVHRRRNRLESLGLWADKGLVELVRKRLAAERATPEWQHKLASSRQTRARRQEAYEGDFERAVLDFLAFAPCHADLAAKLARAVTLHAVPVGSGTVARTERIPLSQRAESAVIAWMRHQTTAYDHMTIARVKGERREVRRLLAEKSRRILARYRAGAQPDPDCPLSRALALLSPKDSNAAEQL